jgi:hypothetical protein
MVPHGPPIPKGTPSSHARLFSDAEKKPKMKEEMPDYELFNKPTCRAMQETG